MGEVHLGALTGDLDVSPSDLPFAAQEEVARSLALVFVIEAPGRAWSSRQWRFRVGEQLPIGFIEADFRALRVIRFGIESQHIFHTGDERPAHFGNAPLLFEPWLEFVFLSTRHTVSAEQLSANFNSTTRSANNCSVQCSRPPGAALHASAIRRASPRWSRTGFLPGRGLSSMPPT